MSASTLLTYKSRIQKILDDYAKYGADPSKMATWNPTTRVRHAAKVAKEAAKPGEDLSVGAVEAVPGISMTRLEIALRPNVKSILVIPADMTVEEASRLKKMIDASVS